MYSRFAPNARICFRIMPHPGRGLFVTLIHPWYWLLPAGWASGVPIFISGWLLKILGFRPQVLVDMATGDSDFEIAMPSPYRCWFHLRPDGLDVFGGV